LTHNVKKITIFGMEKLTINQVADLFEWSKQGVWWHVRKGHIAVVYVDGVAMVERAEVLRYARDREDRARHETWFWGNVIDRAKKSPAC
jgi:hypothetical protein